MRLLGGKIFVRRFWKKSRGQTPTAVNQLHNNRATTVPSGTKAACGRRAVKHDLEHDLQDVTAGGVESDSEHGKVSDALRPHPVRHPPHANDERRVKRRAGGRSDGRHASQRLHAPGVARRGGVGRSSQGGRHALIDYPTSILLYGLSYFPWCFFFSRMYSLCCRAMTYRS